MASLYITEYAVVPSDFLDNKIAAGAEPNLAEQKITIGVGSTQSAAFNAQTRFVMLHTDAICSLAFGANPTAAATGHRMAAGETRFYGVTGGHKVANITNS